MKKKKRKKNKYKNSSNVNLGINDLYINKSNFTQKCGKEQIKKILKGLYGFISVISVISVFSGVLWWMLGSIIGMELSDNDIRNKQIGKQLTEDESVAAL